MVHPRSKCGYHHRRLVGHTVAATGGDADDGPMTSRIEGTVTSISWIPSEAVAGITKVPFSSGVAHYDPAPPDHIGGPDAVTLDELRDADRFRFANRLRAFAEFDDAGRVITWGYLGGGHIGATTMNLFFGSSTIAAVPMTDKQVEPEFGEGWVRFVQSAGGRTGVPAPRTVKHPPFIQFHAPTAWTTLSLTLHADGLIEQELVGASPFPRHWLYDSSGAMVAKSGLIEFKDWYKGSFGRHTPWGDVDSPALATEVETALERELSEHVMRGGAKPKIHKIKAGETLVEQGDPGDELFLVLDGVIAVEVDGASLAEIGPGAILGERAVLEAGLRTSTLRAVTPCKVAGVPGSQIEPGQLSKLAQGHRREDVTA